MLDDETPHVRAGVQAIRNGKVVAATSSDRSGKYRFTNLKPGQYQLRCHVLDGYVYYGEEKVKGPEGQEVGGDILKIESGKSLRDIDIHFPPFRKGTWRNFTSLDGLANNMVTAIYRVPDGVLWFGTERSGISRYDGREFVNFTQKDGLAGDIVIAICGAPDGAIWFGIINRGVSRYDGKEFVNLYSEDGLADNRVDAIYCDPDGIMWFGTYGGVSRYDGKGFVNLTTEDGLVHDQVYAIYRTPDGVMWFGTGGGVSCYDGKKFTNFTTEDGLVHNRVSIIHCDPDGTMWFGTGGRPHMGGSGGGISRYDGKKFTNFTTEDGLANRDVCAIYRDPNGILWFGTGGGVSRYDGDGFINFTTEDGLVHNKVNAIHGGPDGVLWLGTSGGVSRYDGKAFISFTSKDGLINDDIAAGDSDRDGMMWLSSIRSGVSRYDGRDFTNFTGKDGLANNYVHAIHCAPDGLVWFAAGRSVSRYDGKEFVNYTLPSNSENVPALHRGPDGIMWFGTAGSGLHRYDGEEFVSFTQEDGLLSDWVRAIYCDPDGVVWAGGGGGVSRYDGKEFVNFTPRDGVAHDEVRAVHRDSDGIMWFGTNGGVNRYDGEEFISFTTKDGLAHNSVAAIYSDTGGNIWFGTDGGGVSQYDGIAWASLDTRDGLAGDSVRWIHQDSDGSFWFGTDRGLTHYHKSDVLPEVHIVSVTTDRIYSDLSEIRAIKPGTRVTVEYSALDFKTVPAKQQYRCQIRETDADWRKPTKATQFDWTPDEPGTYTFMVQAIDRDLNYSDPATLKLEVKVDPLEERLAELEVDLAEKNRQLEANIQALQKAKEAAEEAQRAAEAANRAKSAFLANMSHEIRTPMNAILGYAGILRRDGDLRPHQQEPVETIQKSGEHLLALINDILDLSRIEAGGIELQENDFDLTALIDGLSIMFRLRCKQKGLAWRVEWRRRVGEEVGEWVSERTQEESAPHSLTYPLTHSPNRLLVHGDGDKLRQILINLLANAVKFTDSGEVRLRISDVGQTVSLPSQADSLHCYLFEVIDTGVGIFPEDQANIFEPFQQGEAGTTKGGTGLGLAIAQKHIEIMGGQLGVDSELGKGSRFFFTVPLKPAIGEIESLWIDAEEQVVHLQEGYSVKALVADDNQENRDVLSKILLDIGCEVLLAEDGGQAVEMVREHRPDIVFMDIRMPVMNGLEAAQQIWTFFGRTSLRIVAVSASALKHEQQTYLEAGFDGFIAKPFRFEQICECLENLLAVEYETDKVEETQPTEEVLDVSLPEELLMRLKSSAELYRVTELESHLPELEELGAEGSRLAERLRGLIRNYDMKTILNILSEMQ